MLRKRRIKHEISKLYVQYLYRQTRVSIGKKKILNVKAVPAAFITPPENAQFEV